jgi:hypothetical protein
VNFFAVAVCCGVLFLLAFEQATLLRHSFLLLLLFSTKTSSEKFPYPTQINARTGKRMQTMSSLEIL